MNRAAREAAKSFVRELDQKLNSIPTTPKEREEIRAFIGLRTLTITQQAALTYALTDQARAVERDRAGYYENVPLSDVTERGRKQLVEAMNVESGL